MEDIACANCGATEGFDDDDGFYSCRVCFARAEDIMATEYQHDELLDNENANYHLSIHRQKLKNVHIKTETVTLLSQAETPGFYRTDELRKPKEEHVFGEPSIPCDIGASIDATQLSVEDLSSEIRIRYVMGVQLMIQSQCQVLMEKFGVSPLICGLSGVIWMRYVAGSRVFDEEWADKKFEDSEVQYQGFSEERMSQSQPSKGTFNMYGQSAAMIWFRSLRKSIPISSSLVVSFLACHVAREPILPTDICAWSLEGKLPYLTTFIDIEKHLGRPSSACPLSSSMMFRPYKVIGPRELESQAGLVAQSIGLQLPPVNFFAIARRYLKQLSLPHENILPHATRIYEWSMPPDLWLSANAKRLPTRVCVMSIVLVTIRLLYNINGFGIWEENLHVYSSSKTNGRKRVSKDSCRSSSLGSKMKTVRRLLHIQDADFDATELLRSLEAMYKKTKKSHEYSKDLPTYLKYCKDVVFAGLKPLLEDGEEERIMEKLWNFYEHPEDTETDAEGYTTPGKTRSTSEGRGSGFSSDDKISIKRQNVSSSLSTPPCSLSGPHGSQDENMDAPSEQEGRTTKEAAVKQMKFNMEENGFCYIPPRVKLKRFDHLHYIRKNEEGSRSYVAHADYYILLRACAHVAQVGVQYMHAATLRLEKRLSWIENWIDQSLQFTPPDPPAQTNDELIFQMIWKIWMTLFDCAAVSLFWGEDISVMLSNQKSSAAGQEQMEPDHDRGEELKSFDDTKAGVKGLVDKGITKLPRIFIHPPDDYGENQSLELDSHFQIPVIDLKCIHDGCSDCGMRRDEVVEVHRASERWGFFQVVNHDIPVKVLEK